MPQGSDSKTPGLPLQIAQRLLQRIVDGEFPPGVMLPSERTLQEEYGVSRTVIREAIKVLASRKVVTINPAQGVVVRSNAIEPVADALLMAVQRLPVRWDDIYHVRCLLETETAILACQNALPMQILELNEIVDDFESLRFAGDEADQEHDIRRFSELDMRFHRMIAEASQNNLLVILVDVIVGMLWQQEQSRMGANFSPVLFLQAIVQHQEITSAIADRDSERARVAIQNHIDYASRNATNRLERIELAIDRLI